MRKAHSKAVRLMLLITLLGGMAALAGTSTIVLAQNQIHPLAVCAGPCSGPDNDCVRFPMACHCNTSNICVANTP
jgi:hypothetical protein